jgi:hypothetical protein
MCYGLDGTGIKFHWGARFSTPVRTGPGANPASYTMGTGLPFRGQSGRRVVLTISPPTRAELNRIAQSLKKRNLWSCITCIYIFFHGATAPSGPGPHCRGFTMTLRYITFGTNLKGGRSVRRRDLYLTQNTHKRKTFVPLAGF